MFNTTNKSACGIFDRLIIEFIVKAQKPIDLCVYLVSSNVF